MYNNYLTADASDNVFAKHFEDQLLYIILPARTISA